MLIVALATPAAFGAEALVFGVAYFFVRALHLVLYAIASGDDPELHAAVLRFVPGAVLGPSLLVVASFFDGPVELALWATALTIDYLSALLGRGRGWRLSRAHFVERHGLIIIIALGESIVATGVGAAGLPLDAPRIAAALLGMVVAAALWWSYFDWVIFISEASSGGDRCRARGPRARPLLVPPHADGLRHRPLCARHEGDPWPCRGAAGDHPGHRPVRRSGAVHGRARRPAAADRGGWGHGRPVATIVLLALIPVATVVPALVALALAAAVCATLIAYEALRYRYARTWIRDHRGEFTMEEVARFAGPGAHHERLVAYALTMAHVIDYIELSVDDLEQSKAFYTKALRMAFNDYGPDYAGINTRRPAANSVGSRDARRNAGRSGLGADPHRRCRRGPGQRRGGRWPGPAGDARLSGRAAIHLRGPLRECPGGSTSPPSNGQASVTAPPCARGAPSSSASCGSSSTCTPASRRSCRVGSSSVRALSRCE